MINEPGHKKAPQMQGLRKQDVLIENTVNDGSHNGRA